MAPRMDPGWPQVIWGFVFRMAPGCSYYQGLISRILFVGQPGIFLGHTWAILGRYRAMRVPAWAILEHPVASWYHPRDPQGIPRVLQVSAQGIPLGIRQEIPRRILPGIPRMTHTKEFLL